jgi:hypothetical protein
MKVTLPAVAGLVPAITVAVKVTESPYAEGFKPEMTVVDVVRLLTVCVNAAEVLAAKPRRHYMP